MQEHHQPHSRTASDKPGWCSRVAIHRSVSCLLLLLSPTTPCSAAQQCGAGRCLMPTEGNNFLLFVTLQHTSATDRR
ncbi:hypothetical protein DL95DRAFT_391483, partial [Leptodontidium sp. 2 PMI_412]